jgi:hypothetical protein
MNEPAILWEQLAIGNGIERCISSQGQPSALSTQLNPFTAKDAKDAKEAGVLNSRSLCDRCVRCGGVSLAEC